ncbi:MAG TPA: hypothetical protein VJ276_25085 [Thermoanaerobaculia bacterium]|nr:hypothetical protein [Thermoanaerobaculia bacterium]
MTSITHGIVGAAGSMGRALPGLLSGTGAELIGVEKDSPESDWTRLWQCDVIWLAVSRDVAGELMKGKRLRPSQLVIDICSIKRGISESVALTGAAHLSLHPMHGPHIHADRQKWFLIGPRDRVPESAASVLTYLEGLGITLIETDSANHHDFMMGILLGLKEIMTLVMDRLTRTYAADCDREAFDIAALLEWSSPVANAVYGAYVHSVLRSEDWLRNELVTHAHGALLQSASRALAELAGELTGLDLEDEFR